MNSRKNRVLASIVLIALILVMSACGGNGSNSSDQNNVSDSANSTGSAPNDSGQKVTLEFFQMKSEVVKMVDDLIQKFEQANPNIDINQNNVPDGPSVWQMRIATNDAPPLFTHFAHMPAFRQAAANGYMADLTNEPFMQRAEESVLKQGVEMNGKNYLMPIALATLGVYYNVDIFNQLGLSVPTTYDELIQVSEKIKAAGITPFLFPDKGVRQVRQAAEATLGLDVPDVNQVFTDVLNGKSHMTDHPGIRRWAEKMVEIRKYGQKDTVGLSPDDAVREFASGKSAMYFQGIWSIVPIKQSNPNLKFDIFPFPADKAEDTKVSFIVDTAIGISSSAINSDDAKKFIDFMSSPENVQVYVDETQFMSAVKGVNNNTAEINRLSDLVKAGKTFPFVETVFPKASMQDDLAQAAQKLIVTKDVDGFIKQLDAAFYNKANQ
ncbi:ABC transporter substrate-binding protein [Paenibacillus alkalitolerans]|uniref:ABC transporter substrate-binding protein n=1 Tax=Paenibacillus alkalitolerans TaxID=2799335 RepID=UPI0018F30E65|nr:extracellular solute-binding protein [Paenibacillus alkalitolerans]